MIEVIRVRRHETLMAGQARRLIERGVQRVDYPGTTPQLFVGWLARHIGATDLGVFLGLVDDMPKTVAIGLLPTSPLMMMAQIPLIYSEGPRAVALKVGARLRSWLVDNGQTRALGLHLGKGLEAFIEVTKHFGVPERWGTLVRYQLEE